MLWEVIAENKRKSVILLSTMGMILLLGGYVLASAFVGPESGGTGMVIAALVWAVMAWVSYVSGDKILLAASHAKEVTEEVHPVLFHVVEEMRIAANLSVMPKVYIIDDPSPNAFATGMRPEKSAIAVTAGLLTLMNRDQLQGVIAHEMSHIVNRDVYYVTMAGVMLGSLQLLSQMFMRSLWYSGGSSRRYRSSSRSSEGGAQAIFMVLAILFAILGPIAAQLFYFSLSRKREYLADASGVRLTRYPEGLAGALEKLAQFSKPMAAANPITAPMYINLPRQKNLLMSGLLSTHPPIEKRIQILRAMAGERVVDFSSYEKSYEKVTGERSRLLPASALEEGVLLAAREESDSPEIPEEDARTRSRQTMDLMRRLNRFRFVTCSCGVKIKIPPEMQEKPLQCPRCHSKL